MLLLSIAQRSVAQRIILSLLVLLSQLAVGNVFAHPIHCKKWNASCKQYRAYHCPEEHPRSCCEILSGDTTNQSEFKSGVYSIKVGMFSFYNVWCDMTSDDAGWMVIVRRSSTETSFDRLYKDYEDGFGDLKGDFWFGLQYLQQLTNRRSYEMRLDMYELWNDTKSTAHAHYSSFEVTSPEYTLKLGKFNGSDTNLLSNLGQFNKKPFSAKKTKFDDSNICYSTFRSGWWFTEKNCVANTGETPGTVLTRSYNELNWYDISDTNYPFINSRTFSKYELKIRPTDCSTASKSST